MITTLMIDKRSRYHLGIKLLVLPEQVHTELGQSDEVLELPGGRHHHLADHVLGGRVQKLS